MERAIPIFAFHRVGPRTDCRFTVPTEVFDRYLAVVQEEGYSTLTCTDLASIVLGRARTPSRACLLTFDDGYVDNWVYAGPLLRRRQMRGTIFAVLNRLQSGGAVRPTLEDVWSRRCHMEELYQLPEMPRINRRMLDPDYLAVTDHLSLEEARLMVRLGICEVQSHGLDHMVHYASNRLTGFLHPLSHWTAVAAARGDARLGTPIYEACSVLVGPRYLDPQVIRDQLARVVTNSGGASFFERRDWSEILGREFDVARTHAGAGCLEPEATWRARILDALQTCICSLNKQIGAAVHSLAWPFGASSEQSQKIALAAGFTLAFSTKVGGYVAGMPHARIGRISLKQHDESHFRSALQRCSDPEYVRQQLAGSRDDGPLAIAV
jgi:peptidoglycan/xylan/chitin deacetylase (PgdA/CDA1 family)